MERPTSSDAYSSRHGSNMHISLSTRTYRGMYVSFILAKRQRVIHHPLSCQSAWASTSLQQIRSQTNWNALFGSFRSSQMVTLSIIFSLRLLLFRCPSILPVIVRCSNIFIMSLWWLPVSEIVTVHHDVGFGSRTKLDLFTGKFICPVISTPERDKIMSCGGQQPNGQLHQFPYCPFAWMDHNELHYYLFVNNLP